MLINYHHKKFRRNNWLDQTTLAKFFKDEIVAVKSEDGFWLAIINRDVSIFDRRDKIFITWLEGDGEYFQYGLEDNISLSTIICKVKSINQSKKNSILFLPRTTTQKIENLLFQKRIKRLLFV